MNIKLIASAVAILFLSGCSEFDPPRHAERWDMEYDMVAYYLDERVNKEGERYTVEAHFLLTRKKTAYFLTGETRKMGKDAILVFGYLQKAIMLDGKRVGTLDVFNLREYMLGNRKGFTKDQLTALDGIEPFILELAYEEFLLQFSLMNSLVVRTAGEEYIDVLLKRGKIVRVGQKGAIRIGLAEAA